MIGNQTAPVTNNPETLTDPVEAAKAAGLRYVSDDRPGLRRKRNGKGFTYLDANSQIIRDKTVLQRIKSLVIPPAWTDVWICPQSNGHIQVTARDSKGRKQYRYHTRWREIRDETKYTRLLEFAKSLPKIRRRVNEDLKLSGMPREKILATIVRLLETTFIRIGNEAYARDNHSFGLTTLRTRHVDVSGTTLKFQFRGKSGKFHSITLSDPKLAKVIKRCQDLPGQELFQFIDEAGMNQTITSADVNQYLRDVSGQDFTAKDFRTWAGTVLAACALSEFEAVDSETEAKKNVATAIQKVAERLGNTPAICRKCYIHPLIIQQFLNGDLPQNLPAGVTTAKQTISLRKEEREVVKILEGNLNTQNPKSP
jgi:DNA topoisomerase-1